MENSSPENNDDLHPCRNRGAMGVKVRWIEVLRKMTCFLVFFEGRRFTKSYFNMAKQQLPSVFAQQLCEYRFGW